MLDQVEEVAVVAEDCARLVADTACRIDVATLAVRLVQLRLCVIAMLRAYNEVAKLMEEADGSDEEADRRTQGRAQANAPGP